MGVSESQTTIWGFT